MSDVFISYADSDRSTAHRLAQALQQEGWSVCWDHSLPAGKALPPDPAKALAKARCVVVLWSPAAVDSLRVNSEAAEAQGRGMLVSALVEATELPPDFRQVPTANLVAWPEQAPELGYARLLRAIRTLLKGATAEPAGQKTTADHPRQPPPQTNATPKQPDKWPKGLGSKLAFLSLLSGTVLAGLFKAFFPQTPISEALTSIALLSLLCGAGLSLGWAYLKRKE